jgi:hypothetical protein
MEGSGPNLDQLSVPELLRLSRDILRQLRTRDIIRSSNAPAGNYAELLTQRLTGGELAPNSQKSWDARSSVRCFSAPPLLKRRRYGVSTSTAGSYSRGTISWPTVKTVRARWLARSFSALHPSGGRLAARAADRRRSARLPGCEPDDRLRGKGDRPPPAARAIASSDRRERHTDGDRRTTAGQGRPGGARTCVQIAGCGTPIQNRPLGRPARTCRRRPVAAIRRLCGPVGGRSCSSACR